MSKNRLKLDFSLEKSIDRKNFVQEYLKQQQFQDIPLTQKELNTISDYILWGKDEDGKNMVQKKYIEIETKYKTWKKEKNIESLEELMENPAFDENIIVNIGTTPISQKKETFNREKALKEAPKEIVNTYLELFKQIDSTDLLINYYEIINNKRKKEPREELLKKFNEEEKNEIYNRALLLDQRQYLKLRHFLVELRSQQFTLKDSYTFSVQKESKNHIKFDGGAAMFDEDIEVFPLGLFNDSKLAEDIFINQSEFVEKQYTKEQIKKVIDYYWKKDLLYNNKQGLFFDFCNLDHVYQLLLNYKELEIESQNTESSNNSAAYLLKTLQFYLDGANLNEMQREIFKLKIEKKKNEEIAKYINQKYDKSYTINYISTIFKQKIIKEINQYAEFHKEFISNICFPENFKPCTRCGKYLLKSPWNFVRKTRAIDGFTGRCKKCDKEVREERNKRRE